MILGFLEPEPAPAPRKRSPTAARPGKEPRQHAQTADVPRKALPEEPHTRAHPVVATALDFPARVAAGRARGAAILTAGLIAALALHWLGVAHPNRVAVLDIHAPVDKAAVNTIVERIIVAESSGDPNAKNKRSSATGAAQFLDETWLRMVRLHRPDLARLGEKEVLDLRRDPDLAREITARFAERNAAILARRGLAVTPGRLYLSHFAGGIGAVAILLAPDDADAATVMASADASGRATREKIVKANPFLETFTIAAIKRWADRRMCRRLSSAEAKAGAAPAPSCGS